MSTPREQRQRNLYAEEAEARLTRLSEAALGMQADLRRAQPPDPGVVEGMLREARTITGGASVVGFTHVGEVARALEAVLGSLRGERVAGTGSVVHTVLAAVEGLRVLLGAAVRGQEHAVQAASLTARIRGRHISPTLVPHQVVAAGPDPLGGRADQPKRPVSAPLSPAAQPRPAQRAPAENAASVPTPVAAEAVPVPVAASPASRADVSPLPCLVVAAGGQRYAVPLQQIALVLPAVAPVSGSHRGPAIWVEGEPVSISDLATVLGNASSQVGSAHEGPAVVLRGLEARHAFAVEELVGLRDLVVASLSPLLPRPGCVSGTVISSDGGLLLVLDPDVVVERAERSAHGAPEQAAPDRHRPARVLVVDNARVAREVHRSVLAGAGHEVKIAATGAEALAAIRRSRPDLLLTDADLPGMDGLELTRAVRADPDLAGLPVVLLTARAAAADRQAGLEAGADAYLLKGAIDVVELRATVTRLLGHRP